ncbi:serine hydrolase domain-containing protein [Sphingomicrobium sp. XHP0235]|uniref:serine hydrolase domain-containing protein n=1 Tax=Sphingomicrobium aquimarinum TaxID=3133971 RepID=UPI0031FE4F5F
MRFLLLLLPLLLFACGPSRAPLERGDFDAAEWATIEGSVAETLFWSDEEKAGRFSSFDRRYAGDEVPSSGSPLSLMEGATEDFPAMDLLFEEHDLSGLLLLDGTRIVYERRGPELPENARWTSYSVAKVLTGILAGAALADGVIASIDDPVIRYVPELADTAAYEGVTVRHLLEMTSGVSWNVDPSDKRGDGLLSWTPYGRADGTDNLLDLLRARTRIDPPGTRRVYKGIDSALLALVVERATGQTLARYAADRIAVPAGLAAPLFWMRRADAGNTGDCCVSMTLRDYGRLGLWVARGLPDGAGGSVWTDTYRGEAFSVRDPDASESGYGYHWDITPDWLFHRGLYGQGLFVSRRADVVLVHLAAWESGVDGAARKAVDAALADYMRRREAQPSTRKISPVGASD